MTNREHPFQAHAHDPARQWDGAQVFLGRGRWVFWAFAALAATYLVAEHRAHVVGVLPILLILACPLMHVFMHRNHGAHGGHVGHGDLEGAPGQDPTADNPRDRKE